MHHLPVGLLSWFFIVLVAGQVAASDERASSDSLEELMNTEVTTVIGASKYQQDLTAAPASVSIVTADDIRKGGYRTLAEILNSVRGFFVTYDRNYHYVGLRGFSPLGDYGTRLLLLIDGHRLNDAVYEQSSVGGDFPVDIDLIDRIEIIRGPGSSLYGSNAFLGVVNVLTRKGKDLNGGEVSLSGGSFDTWTERATGGGKIGGGDLLFSLSNRESAGRQNLSFPEYAATNNGIAHDLDGERSWDFLTKLAWQDLSLLMLHQNRDKAVPTASFASIFNDPDEMTSDIHTLLGLNYNPHTAFADLNVRLTYNRYEYQGDFPLDYDGVRTLNRDLTVAEWLGSDLYATKLFGDHLVTIGMEDRWQFTEKQRNEDVGPIPAMVLDDSRSRMVQGYYVQDEDHLLKNLILNAGLRYDRYDDFGDTINPRVALIWKPRESTVLRWSYGEAFRAPNAYEQYYGDNVGFKGNLDLQPEKIRTLELGWEQFIGHNLKTTAIFFSSRIEDQIEQVVDPADGLLVFRNQGTFESEGVELELEGKWESGISGRASYCFQESKKPGGQILTNSPEHLAKGSLTVLLPLKKSFVTLEALYGGSRLNAAGDKIGDSYLVNLTLLSRNLLEGLDLSASIYNLFDSRYAMPAGSEQINSLSETLRSIEQDGITFRLKATYRF